MILNNALNYAVERNLIPENPVKSVKWTAPKPSRAIDRGRVANPIQVRTILREIKERKRSSERLYACYATMYFAGARPEEALNLRKQFLTLPAPHANTKTGKLVYGWGKIYVEKATPHAGKEWTDSGKARDARGLKHRERGEGRHLPRPPELTEILWWHLDKFGGDDEGRLFRGERGGDVPLITWKRVWQAARTAVFTDEVAATPLARRPYDLRHAAVSTWLNGGVPPTTVAEWAGHSVEVLLQVYAKCLDGQDHQARLQVEQALGHQQNERRGGTQR
jgi:integrase